MNDIIAIIGWFTRPPVPPPAELEYPVHLDGTERQREIWTREYLKHHHETCPCVTPSSNLLSRLHAKNSPLRHERVIFYQARHHWFALTSEIYLIPWSFVGEQEEAHPIFRAEEAIDRFASDLNEADSKWTSSGPGAKLRLEKYEFWRNAAPELWDSDEDKQAHRLRLETKKRNNVTGRKNRSEGGGALIETTAALVVAIPLTMLLVYVTIEVSYSYFLKATLAQCARQAARDLAVGYGSNPVLATDRQLQDETVFDHIRISNIVNDSEQFEDPEFNTGADPHRVKVVVRYTGGQHGLPKFPNPDPLNLTSLFQLKAESTYRLE